MITEKKLFDYNGKTVSEFILKNDFISVGVLNFGGIIHFIKVKTKSGEKDVVLGYDDAKDYIKDTTYFGATIGRVCNRIANAEFTLNGKKYSLDKNDGDNSLHGGFNAFNKKVWDAEVSGEKLVLSYRSPDGEGGFPAELTVKVAFSLKNGGVSICYYATSDNDTPVNLTNHSYFNLGENVVDTELFIDADRVTPPDITLIPKGFLNIDKTPFDFRKFKKIGLDLDENDVYLNNCGGYDINYCLNKGGFKKAAVAKTDEIIMNVYTDCVGLQFYSGNFLSREKGKCGKAYLKRSGFCLETQGYPNAVNDPAYPSIILKKGEEYKSETVYEFLSI